MRISPYLSGETIDAFLQAAARRGIPVRAAGLERVDGRWAELQPKAGACGGGSPQLVLLVGDLGSSNNVAFTEAYSRRRKGASELWVLGHDSEPARRVAARVIADVHAGITEAVKTGLRVTAWVNPEEAPTGALDALLAARGKLDVQLFWSSRNAGYLFARQTPAAAAADLYLDVGVEESANGTRRIAWGKKQKGDEEMFIPLPRELWIFGRSHPTGLPSTTSGNIDLEALKETAALL